MSERLYPLQDFTPDQCATYSRIMGAEPAPESWVQQHAASADCYCGPVQHGDAWDHR